MNLEKIYELSPIFLQNIMISLKGYINVRSRYGKEYFNHLKFLEQFDKFSLEEKINYQLTELKNLIRHAKENSLFYKKLYEDINIEEILEIKDLKKLPILTKEMLRANIDNIVTIEKKDGIISSTGGTTGKSLIILMEKDNMMKRMAILDHFKKRVGFEHLKMKRATFNGKHIVPPKQKQKLFWRYNYLCKQMIYSSFHLSEENIKYYVESLNKFKPQALDGFFMSMCDIAHYIERKNIKLEFIPIAIFPTSETLTDSGRELLERVFKCKVYNQYASSEGAPFVTECQNQILHQELSTGIFEYFEEESEEVLVTSFTTYGTPLIRYKIGDSMKLTNNSDCKCGINAPIVEYIQGRKLDFLYTTNKAKINAGNISNLFKNMPNSLIRAQLIQNKIGEINIYLEVDNSKYLPKYDELLKKEFTNKFGLDSKIKINHVEKILREKSGKFRMIKNNVVNPKF